MSISLEPRLIGPHTARLRLSDFDSESSRMVEIAEQDVSIADLETLQLHVQQALRRLRDRRTMDLILGHCDKCDDTRLVRGEHCPVCWPVVQETYSKIEGWK